MSMLQQNPPPPLTLHDNEREPLAVVQDALLLHAFRGAQCIGPSGGETPLTHTIHSVQLAMITWCLVLLPRKRIVLGISP